MWYLYEKDTSRIVKSYKSHAAALAARTRLHKKYLADNGFYVSNDGPLFDLAVADSQYYHMIIEQRVTRKNLMTGEDVVIRTEDRGGVCDPSMERYWTM